MPAAVIAGWIGGSRSMTALEARIAELRPVHLPPDPASRMACVAGGTAQFGGHDERGAFVAGGDELDEQVGGLGFEGHAADLVDDRSNEPFGRWGEVFGDEVVAAAVIDRLVHHARSSVLRETATGSRTAISAAPTRPPPKTHDREGVSSRPSLEDVSRR